MGSLMTQAIGLTLALALLACNSAPSPQGEAGAIAGRVGDRAITMKDVEERWRAVDPAEYTDATFKVYEGRHNALESLIAEQLFTEASKGSGLSPEAYAEMEISRRTKEVTDEEVASFYTANLREMQGR